MKRYPLFPAVAFGLALLASTASAEPTASLSDAALEPAGRAGGARGAGQAGVPIDDLGGDDLGGDDLGGIVGDLGDLGAEEEGDALEPDGAEAQAAPAKPVRSRSKAAARPKRAREASSGSKGAKKIARGLAPAGVPVAGPGAGPAVAPVAGPGDPGAGPVRTDFNLTMLAASPVPGVESSGFGWRADPLNNRRKFHKGTDFRAPRGTPVFAAGGGTVTFAGRMGGYGNVVFIDHGDGVISRYGHLRRIGTQRNARVVSGAQIGEVGSTGRATGPHLHFEVRLDGRAVNPSVAMSLAALQRKDPAAARAAMAVLVPEVQQAFEDPHSRGNKRPDRKARAKRNKNLW